MNANQGDLGLELRAIANRIERIQNAYLKQRGYGEYSTTQCGIIGYIRNHEGNVYSRDLEKVLCIRSSSITGIVERMEKKGMLSRVQVKHDGRMKKLVLVPGREALFKEASNAVLDVEADLIKNISSSERTQLFLILTKLKATIDEMEEAISAEL